MRAAIILPVCLVVVVVGSIFGFVAAPSVFESKTVDPRFRRRIGEVDPYVRDWIGKVDPAQAVPAPAIADRPVIVPASPAADGKLGPRVDAPRLSHDFGVMELGEPGQHTFKVRNTGDEPLTLEILSTTCKCTMADLPEGAVARVAPGETFSVTLTWDTQAGSDGYRQGATLRTNDPRKPKLELVIEGRVRQHLGIMPTLVQFMHVGLSERRTQEVILYSEAFDTLDITHIETPEHMSVEVLPVSDAEKQRLEMRQAVRLAITVMPGRPLGGFAEPLLIHYQATGGRPESHHSPYTIQVIGEVVSDFSIHGRNVQANLLSFGPVKQSLGARQTAYLYVRGEQRDVNVLQINTMPEGLPVDIRRDDQPGQRSARYVVTVEVPPGTVPAAYTEDRPGWVEIVTDHPDTPRQKFYVAFTVIP